MHVPCSHEVFKKVPTYNSDDCSNRIFFFIRSVGFTHETHSTRNEPELSVFVSANPRKLGPVLPLLPPSPQYLLLHWDALRPALIRSCFVIELDRRVRLQLFPRATLLRVSILPRL